MMRIPSWAAALLFACAVAPAFAAEPGAACDPGGAGAPCGGAQVAGMDNTGGPAQGAGNPVNFITGNKYQRETDMAPLPGVLGLEVVRHYNSSHALAGEPDFGLGRGWQLSYETRLYPIGAALHIVQADGARLVFARSVVGAGLYRHADPARGAVRVARIDGGDEYAWIWPNGRDLRFDRNGRLIRIALPSGEALDLQRTPEGRLLRVRDPQGRELRIRYANDATHGERIAGIDTPVGRIDYEHGEAKSASGPRLEAVRLPGGRGKTMRRLYHYEDERHPLLLTGISVEAQGEGKLPGTRERLRGWTYDAAGHAVSSLAGESLRMAADGKPVAVPGDEQLTFRRLSPGLTLLTDRAGRSTTYRHAIINGEFRLLEARGAGCASCGPENLRYGYDALARLTEVTRLDAAGKPLEGRALALDALGRLLSVTRIDYANGKPARRTLLMRQQYAPEIGPFLWPWQGRARPPFGPVLIAWPSVVPGREHQLRIQYNRHQQPVLITESGFDARDGTKIERSTRYRYEDWRGRSLLTEVEGPLSPGADPATADITRHLWDAQGNFIVRSVLPGNVELAFARNEDSGRLTAMTLRWDDVIRRRTFETDASGRLLAQGDAALDADGHVIATRRTDIETDARGRPARIRWPDGGESALTRDASGLPTPVPLPGGGLALWPQEGEDWAAPASAALKAMRGPAGSAAENIVLRYDANARSAERKLDDFGRVVAIRLPEQGWQSARYDAADRIVHITDPRGATTAVVRDAAGRLQGATRAMADGTLAEELRFAWRGPYRVEEALIEDGRSRRINRYRHGPFGEIERTELEIDDDDGTPLRMALETRFDEVGRRTSQTLPGGERIVWRYFAAAPYRGQRAAVERLRWPAWLDRWMVKLPESWLDALKLKLRLAELEPEDRRSESASSLAFAAAPQAEPGLADTAPGSERDAAGLPHRLRTAKGEFRLAWNAAGALAEVRALEDSAAAAVTAPIARYRYDARGRRVAKHAAGVSEYFLYDGTQLVVVAKRDGKRLRVRSEYLYAEYRPLLWFRDGEALRLETDQRGAVLAASEPASKAGNTTKRWQSNIDAWGGVRASGDADPHLRLVNQYADEETGLHYHLARYYDPASGRFLSPDPAGIADSIDAATPDALKLDISVYVSGQPSLYFDPDAAAKLVYYALTTDAKGKALPTKQGFTGARWAFSIEDIQASATTGDAALDSLIRDYAQKHTGLLYDLGGDFLTDRKKPYATWEGAADETVDAFKKHYQGKMVQLPQFTFASFSDKDAALLIARVTGNTKDLGSCPAAGLLLPEISFAEEEVPINVTTDGYVDPKQGGKRLADLQRIVVCGENADEDRRRIKKYNYAAMLLESVPSAINVDCSKNGGCPGRSLNSTVLFGYVASYGKTQFIVSTMLESLKTMHEDKSLTDQKIRSMLRLDDESLWGSPVGRDSLMLQALKRAASTANFFSKVTINTPDWAQASADKKREFMVDTGLQESDSEAIWNDMVNWRKNPSANLNGEASAAFVSTIVFKNEAIRSYLMSIFSDSTVGGAFDRVSEYLMGQSYGKIFLAVDDYNQFPELLKNGSKNPEWLAREREIEIEFAARTARIHNGDLCAIVSGTCKKNVAQTGTIVDVMTADSRAAGRQYAARFLNVMEYPVQQPSDPRRQQPTGDYFSLRCAEKLPPEIIPRAGMQIIPLKI